MTKPNITLAQILNQSCIDIAINFMLDSLPQQKLNAEEKDIILAYQNCQHHLDKKELKRRIKEELTFFDPERVKDCQVLRNETLQLMAETARL